MINVYSPIDMDGVPWTSELSGVIQDLCITFWGEGFENTSNLTKGQTKLLDFRTTVDGDWSFEVNAVHPMTGKLFKATIERAGASITRRSAINAIISANIIADRELQFSEVSVLPTAVCFLEVEQPKNINIDITTNSPIVTSAIGNTVLIEIEDSINKYQYTESTESGLLRINGVSPIAGNINISGVGQTLVWTK